MDYEVHANSYFSLNKTRNLISELEGRTTIDESLRYEKD